MRRYLAEFLSDPRVVGLPRWLWLPILFGFVLRTRPARSAQRYSAIWTPEGSPLAVHTRRQADLLRAFLSQDKISVEYAMRYGAPSIRSGLEKLAGCKQIVVLPLYPQYSRSTTESIRDVIGPHVPMIESFHDHPGYIAALAASVRAQWALHGEPDVLLMSFHGLPRREIERGDPYFRQCQETANLLARALDLEDERFRIGFQSRFGAAAWVQPYTSTILRQLGASHTRRVQVVCPGFVSDCLETLEEIAIEGRQTFHEAGGAEFRALACLNEAPEWIAALAAIAGDPHLLVPQGK